MKEITIVTAILMAIKEFRYDEFSIWEITKNIREKIDNGDYTLKFHGLSAPHWAVKSLVEDFIVGGLFDEYSVRTHIDGYRIFQKEDTAKTAIPSHTPPIVVHQQKTTNTTVLPTDVQLKIFTYLKNNGPVTMKQIQSRLKGHGYTCSEIYDFFDKINLIQSKTLTAPISQRWTLPV